MLPFGFNEVNEASELLDNTPEGQNLLEEIDAAMDQYFDELMTRLAQKYGLSEEQVMDLGDRLCWTIGFSD